MKKDDCTQNQIGDARKIIDILMTVPKDKQSMVAALTTAYIDGIEAGSRLAEDERGA